MFRMSQVRILHALPHHRPRVGGFLVCHPEPTPPMDLQTIRANADAITAVGVALATLWAGWRYVWPMAVCLANRIRSVFNTMEQMPGLLTEYQVLQGQVHDFAGIAQAVQRALATDDPDSLPSRMTMLVDQGELRSQQLTTQGEQISTMGRQVAAIANTQRAVMNTNPRMATFEADDTGMWTAVNRVYGKWTGLSIEEAGRWGWLNAVHPDDQARVRLSWVSCVQDTRRFECRFRLIHTASGKQIEVDASADPIPENTAPCERWLGTMYEVQSGAIA